MAKVNCFKCKHFFPTWNPKSPRGCKAYGFKGKGMPSEFILKTTGTGCMQFVPKLNGHTPSKTSATSKIDIRL